MLLYPSKWIQKSEDLTKFSRFFDKPHCRGALDMDWLQKNRAVGLYDEERLIGGVVMESFPYARALEGVADAERQRLFQQLDETSGIALNAFWLDKSLQDNRLRPSGWLMIAKICFHIWASGKVKFILFRTTSTKLSSLYASIGVSAPIDCRSEKDSRNISAFTVKVSLLNFFKLLRFVMWHGLQKVAKAEEKDGVFHQSLKPKP